MRMNEVDEAKLRVDIGHRLDRRRKELGMTYVQLSEGTKLQPTAVKSYLEGTTQKVSIYRLHEMASTLGMELIDLMGEFIYKDEEVDIVEEEVTPEQSRDDMKRAIRGIRAIHPADS